MWICIGVLVNILFILLMIADHKYYERKLHKSLNKKPKKKREIKFRKKNYPFDSGDYANPDDFK